MLLRALGDDGASVFKGRMIQQQDVQVKGVFRPLFATARVPRGGPSGASALLDRAADLKEEGFVEVAA